MYTSDLGGQKVQVVYPKLPFEVTSLRVARTSATRGSMFEGKSSLSMGIGMLKTAGTSAIRWAARSGSEKSQSMYLAAASEDLQGHLVSQRRKGGPVPLVVVAGSLAEEVVNIKQEPGAFHVHGCLTISELRVVGVAAGGEELFDAATVPAILEVLIVQIYGLHEDRVCPGHFTGECSIYGVGTRVMVPEDSHEPLRCGAPIGAAGGERYDTLSLSLLGQAFELLTVLGRLPALLFEETLVV